MATMYDTPKESLLDQVRSGKRRLSVSLYFEGQEMVMICNLSFKEAAALIQRPMASRWGYRLTESQWLSADPDAEEEYEYDPYGNEVTSLRRALLHGSVLIDLDAERSTL